MPPRVGQRYGRFKFNPYAPPPIPTGSFDPSLDAQREAANRGLGDLKQDIDTAGARDRTDYGLGQENIRRDRDWTLDDLSLSRGRGYQDAELGGQRLDEDYQRNLALLADSYQRLGVRQQEGANVAGVMRGGALLQAARKRAGNMAQDKSQIDTSYNRAKADREMGLARMNEDFGLQSGRANTTADLQLGQLALQMAPPDEANPLGGRSFQDRNTQLTRAGRENTMFGLDVDAAKTYQATGAGYVPPQMPKNERVDAEGNAYRVVRQGPWVLKVDASGRVLSRRRANG